MGSELQSSSPKIQALINQISNSIVTEVQIHFRRSSVSYGVYHSAELYVKGENVDSLCKGIKPVSTAHKKIKFQYC